MKARKLLAAALMLSMSAGAVAAAEGANQRQITVTGESRVQVAPELATITLGVTEGSRGSSGRYVSGCRIQAGRDCAPEGGGYCV